MKVINASYNIEDCRPAVDIWRMSTAARTCYQSGINREYNEADARKLIKRCVNRGHESILEHSSMTVRFVCDRGVSHELVRHRLAGYSQESTRYCNYSNDKFGNEITVVRPWIFTVGGPEQSNDLLQKVWYKGCRLAEEAYFMMLEEGASPQLARSVLPNSLKTEVVVTANLREWKHILELRTARDAHPDIRALMMGLLIDLGRDQKMYPEIFGDLALKRSNDFIKDYGHKFSEKGI